MLTYLDGIYVPLSALFLSVFSNSSMSIFRPTSEFNFRFFGDPSAYNASFNALAQLRSAGKIDDELQLGGTFTFDIQPSLKLHVSILFIHSCVCIVPPISLSSI